MVLCLQKNKREDFISRSCISITWNNYKKRMFCYTLYLIKKIIICISLSPVFGVLEKIKATAKDFSMPKHELMLHRWYDNKVTGMLGLRKYLTIGSLQVHSSASHFLWFRILASFNKIWTSPSWNGDENAAYGHGYDKAWPNNHQMRRWEW